MREPIAALLSALDRETGGIAIVWCPDLGLRRWLVGEVEALVSSDRAPFRATSLENALASPNCMALWAPQDESEAVLDLNGSRDRLRNEDSPRTQPIVLFLLRDGDGATALATATSLWSTTAGSDVDPELLSEVDGEEELRRFEDRYGQTPNDWLVGWHGGDVAMTGENFATAYQAMLLEER